MAAKATRCVPPLTRGPAAEQKSAVAVAHCKPGRGVIRVNGSPLDLLQPEPLRLKVYEPILLLGRERFANLDIRIRVRGGGSVAQVYAIRQALAKGLVAYSQKCACLMPLAAPTNAAPRPAPPRPRAARAGTGPTLCCTPTPPAAVARGARGAGSCAGEGYTKV